jgi:hypothetical protein
MRTPNEDDRVLFDALMVSWNRISAAPRAKGIEVRAAFIEAHRGHGTGPTMDQVGEWERLRSLEETERLKVEAVMRSIFE